MTTPPGQQLLLGLLQSWQKTPDIQRRKSLPITREKARIYYDTVDPEAKDELHASLKNAEQAGCVSLVWGKFQERHHLKKIVLEDPYKLAAFLGVTLAVNLAEEYERDLRIRVPDGFTWGHELVDEAISKWRTNVPFMRIAPGDSRSVETLIRALWAVQEGRHEGKDLRTFSAKELGDSKAMEKIHDRFASLWNRRYATPNTDWRELFESLGLAKFPPAVFFKGPLRVWCGECLLDIGKIPAFIGVPPDTITRIELTVSSEKIGHVLTIENLASFNRHCREVDDGGHGIVVFSSGFMSPQTSKVLRQIESLLPKHVEFFHWGDIDPGGLNIYHHINQILERDVAMHLMDPRLLKTHGRPVKDLSFRNLAKTAWQNTAIAELAHQCERTNTVLEQELVDPILPAQGFSR